MTERRDANEEGNVLAMVVGVDLCRPFRALSHRHVQLLRIRELLMPRKPIGRFLLSVHQRKHGSQRTHVEVQRDD